MNGVREWHTQFILPRAFSVCLGQLHNMVWTHFMRYHRGIVNKRSNGNGQQYFCSIFFLSLSVSIMAGRMRCRSFFILFYFFLSFVGLINKMLHTLLVRSPPPSTISRTIGKNIPKWKAASDSWMVNKFDRESWACKMFPRFVLFSVFHRILLRSSANTFQ